MSSSAPTPPTPENSDGARQATVEQLIHQAIRILERSRPMPFSTSVMINGDELRAILQRVLSALPEEMRAARWMLKERDEIRQRAQREGDDIIAAARARVEQMVQRSEVVKTAELRARRTVDEAEARATRMKLETEDWCDQRLAAFEALLHKTSTAVTAGRQRLQDTRMPRPATEPAPVEPEDDIFDQDVSHQNPSHQNPSSPRV